MIGIEILFNPGHHVKSHISKFTDLVIRNDKKDSVNVSERMKELYDKRCDIVHEGKINAVKDEEVLELRDYLRRAIKEVYKINKDMPDLNKMLHSSGFDEKPWRDTAD